MRYLILIVVVFSTNVLAGDDAFSLGPVFKDFGPVADVEATFAIPPGASFKHSFDVAEAAKKGTANSTLVSAARFINMHVKAGVSEDDIEVAVVVHGKAVFDVADKQSGSADLVAALVEQGVGIIVCGQSAAYYDVGVADLMPGVEMALSAMTAHALLQQNGFTVNPF